MIVNRTALQLGAIALLVWISFVLFFNAQIGRRIEYLEFDYLTVITAPKELDVPIIIIGIDEASFAELRYQWPWPRSLHSSLLDKLHQAGAAVVAFDVVFAEPSVVEDDMRFADAIKRAGNVILASDIVLQERQQFTQMINVDPLNQFLEAGAIAGAANVAVDPDLVVRKITLTEDAFWNRTVHLYQRRTGVEKDSYLAATTNLRVRYFGADHVFQYVSYYQALNLRQMLPEGIFKDKIVLIGLDTKVSPEPGASQTDTYATPFLSVSGNLTPGIEIHATFIANALLNRSITELPRVWTLIQTTLVLFLAVISMRNWRPQKSLIIAIAISAGILFMSVWLFGIHDVWLPSVSAMMAPLVYYIFRGGVAYLSERRQRIEVRRAFQHYVSPEVVEEIIQHPELLVLGGSRRKITIMFTDLKGFTSIAESLEPEDVSRLLNSHFSEMTKIIHARGGTVDKFIGDAIMAFWGAPLQDVEQAVHACHAAIAMQDAAAVMREEMVRQGLPGVYMRIGIHTGDAIVGNMGSGDRFDYTAVGDNVNLASRLEGICKQYGTEILISDTTAHEISGKIPTMHIDRVCVRGKSLPVEIYNLQVDPTLQQNVEEAIRSYRDKHWNVAETKWQALLQQPQVKQIAKIYLARIAELRTQELPDVWDGIVNINGANER